MYLPGSAVKADATIAASAPNSVPKSAAPGTAGASSSSRLSGAVIQSNNAPVPSGGVSNQSAGGNAAAGSSLPNLAETNSAETNSAETNNAGSSLPNLVTANNAENRNPPSASSAPTTAANTATGEETAAGSNAINAVLLSKLIASSNRPVPTTLQPLLEDLLAGLTYRIEGTDDESAAENLRAWKASIGRQASAVGIENIDPIFNSDHVLEYPLESALSLKGRSLSVCLEELPGKAEIGLLFDSQGELVGQPVLIRSTGYEVLNREAIAIITQPENLPEELPEDSASKAYLYDVTVDYDNEGCVSLESLQDQ